MTTIHTKKSFFKHPECLFFFLVLFHFFEESTAADFPAGTCTTADLAETGSCSDNPTISGNSEPNAADGECTLYLAPSSIPGAGLGIFTAIDRAEGDIVGYGDVVIPIVDFSYHMSADYKFDDFRHFDPTLNYIWDGREMGLQYETAFLNHGVSAFAPGMHCGINCHLGLINVDKIPPVYDTLNLHRSRDPGAGGFTPYHNASALITNFVPAGGELFENYGDEYFLTRKKLEQVPIFDDYPQAEAFVALFNKMWDDELSHLSFPLMGDLWNVIYEFPMRSRSFNALPKDMGELEQVLLGGSRAILQPHYVRDISYLKERGRCLDNIRSGKSTLIQAGRGAFATRTLKKYEIVTGSPVIWYPNGDYFRMYAGNWTSQHEPPDLQNQTHTQILMNYCWTHPDSSIYLCPYGAGVQYINHNKSQANILVQWTEDREMDHMDEFLSHDPEYMYPLANPGLSVDFVAIRDIAAGEELFMDYGDAWEEAWRSHATRWRLRGETHLPASSSTYISARAWNNEHLNATLRTVTEQEDDPYPDHFMFRCLKEIGLYDLTNEQARELWGVRVVGLPCTIQERDSRADGDMYTVHYLPHSMYEFDVGESGVPGINEEGEVSWMETNNVPREAIRVLDKPYTTDLFLKEAFRHPIGIPDHMFPRAWKGFHKSGVLY